MKEDVHIFLLIVTVVSALVLPDSIFHVYHADTLEEYSRVSNDTGMFVEGLDTLRATQCAQNEISLDTQQELNMECIEVPCDLFAHNPFAHLVGATLGNEISLDTQQELNMECIEVRYDWFAHKSVFYLWELSFF